MWTRRRTLAGMAALCSLAVPARSQPPGVLRVVSSGGFAAAIKQCAPLFQARTGIALDLAWGPSMGATRDAVPQRLARDEPIDVVIMVAPALDALVASGKIAADKTRVLAKSRIGVAVRAGAPHPAIASEADVKAALLAAKSIAYSDSASGVYIERELLPRLGVADQVRAKARMIPAEPVGRVIARGEAEIGFQQLSELRPVQGIDILGPLPDSIQKVTLFAAGVVKASDHAAAGVALLEFLGGAQARPLIDATGLEAV